MREYSKFYIGGEWVDPSTTEHMDVIDSATEEVIGRVPLGAVADVDRAVVAARSAFDTWSTTPVDIRAKYLRDIGAGLAARYDEIVEVISGEVGSPKAFTQFVQAGLSLGEWETFAAMVETYEWEEQVGNSLVVAA